MTLRKFALGSALGMLASALAAYLLPLPPGSPPVPAPSSAPSPSTAAGAAPTPTERAPHLAEMEQEIARLRALLDASPADGSDAAPEDASTSALPDATAAPPEHANPNDPPQDRSQYAPVLPAPISPVTAMPDFAPDSCRVPMSAEQFAALVRTFPSVRYLRIRSVRHVLLQRPPLRYASPPKEVMDEPDHNRDRQAVERDRRPMAP